MSLGIEVGLSPGETVLGRIQLPHGKGHSSPPLFGIAVCRTQVATATSHINAARPSVGELGLHLTQCGLGLGLPPY